MEAVPREARISLLKWISEEYHSMNGSYYDTLDSPPTPLEFSRICHISRPVLIKGCDVSRTRQWTNDFLSKKMGNQLISIAVTPNGFADAVTTAEDGKLYFTEPHVEKMTMDSFLALLEDTSGKAAHYLQSQNGNMYQSSFFDAPDDAPSEFEPLRPDVPAEIDWCSEAFGKHPDAVNLWIGNDRSVTSVHSDPYENIYYVVRGCKTFVLLPPTDGFYLQERLYPHAVYKPTGPGGRLVLTPSRDTPAIRWSSITDPDFVQKLPPSAHPITISVHAGESLYLPAGWWHHVSQSRETTVALNWWYDIESQGMSWVWLNFLRGGDDVPDVIETGIKEEDAVSLDLKEKISV
ncbi:Clavaminate synthase-like protein [Dentipellis sp. KUC8613]|nr:Clavaminate synthase-like protein [Dentipellis sp. KUC8613]